MSMDITTEIERAEQKYRTRVSQAAALRDKEVAAIMARASARPSTNPNLAHRILNMSTHTSRVLRLLHVTPMTTQDLVREIGIDIQAVRTYIYRLRVDGAIVSVSTPGSQEKTHQLTAEARALMDRMSDVLAAAAAV